MPIAHECKCGLVTPVLEVQGGKRIRCNGCGTISLVVSPEVLEPDPVPVPAGKHDSAPPPPPRMPHKYRRTLSREEERADYPRVGGVIDWRQVYDGDEGDYHHDPVPPDPQTRYLNPEVNVGGRLVALAGGGLMILGAVIWVGLAFVVFGRMPFVGLAVAVGLFVIGCGVLVRGFFGRQY